MPETTLTDTPRPEASSMAAKLKGNGPITLTTAEANELRDSIRAVFKRDDVLQALNTMMAQLQALPEPGSKSFCMNTKRCNCAGIRS